LNADNIERGMSGSPIIADAGSLNSRAGLCASAIMAPSPLSRGAALVRHRPPARLIAAAMLAAAILLPTVSLVKVLLKGKRRRMTGPEPISAIHRERQTGTGSFVKRGSANVEILAQGETTL